MTLAPLGDTDVWAHVADQRPTARRLAQTVTGVDVTGWDGRPAFKVSSFLHSHIQPFVLTPLAAFRRNAYTSGWWYTQEPSFQNWRMHRAWDLFSIPGTRVKVRDTYPFIHSLTKHLASARLRKMEERADLGLGNGCLAMTTSAWTIKKENWSIGPHRNGWCLCFKRHH